MATKITTALVAALVAGALMTSNHEALARGGGGHGGGFGGGGFQGGGFHGATLAEDISKNLTNPSVQPFRSPWTCGLSKP